MDFEDPKLGVRSDTGIYDALGGADFNQATFQIFDRNGRGFAKEMSVHPDGKIDWTKVRYTTCPVGNQDWMLQASSITLDTDQQEGTGAQRGHAVQRRAHFLHALHLVSRGR